MRNAIRIQLWSYTKHAVQHKNPCRFGINQLNLQIKSKDMITDEKAVKIFNDEATRHMVQWDLNRFKIFHNKLYLSIIAAIKRGSDTNQF